MKSLTGILVLAGLGVAPALASGEGRVPVVPVGRDGDPNYPVSALRYESEGTSAFELEVAPDGAVVDCRITASAGDAALDREACRYARGAFRFAVVTNAAGKPATGVFASRVKWRMPGGLDQSDPAARTVVDRSYQYIVAPDGTVSNCKAVSQVGADNSWRPCAELKRHEPLTGAAGRAIPVKVVVTQSVRVAPLDPPDPANAPVYHDGW